MKNEEKATDTMSRKKAKSKALSVAGSLFEHYGIYFIFIVMVIIISILSPVFLKVTNLFNVIRQVAVVGTIALGVTMVIISAGIDLSSGSVLALAAVVAASLAQRPDWGSRLFEHLPQLPVILPILAGLAVGTLAGFTNGFIISRTGVPPFIATLGMMVSARGLALMYADGRPVSELTDAFQVLGRGMLFNVIPIPVVVFLGMALVSYILLDHTKFGKYVYAIGGNERAAYVSGINVRRYKTIIYTYAGFLSGLAGILLASRVSSGQPNMGVAYELDAIASSVIGGTSLSGGIGTIPGTIVGALIIGVLKNGLDLLNVSPYWQQIVKGIIIISAVVIDVARKKARG